MTAAPDGTVVAGADACRAGWVVAAGVLAGGGVDAIELRIVERLAAVFGDDPDPAVLAVDIPIGLPERAEPGGRAADRAARAILGPRRSSVFSAPVRAVLDAPDYPSANRASRASSEHAIGLIKQCWNIVPKIREADDLLRAGAGFRARVFEAHPEVCFASMAGAPMARPKSAGAGAAERVGALRAAGVPGADALAATVAGRGAKTDDALDALACLVTASRIARGVARRLPEGAAQTDGAGLPMAIWA